MSSQSGDRFSIDVTVIDGAELTPQLKTLLNTALNRSRRHDTAPLAALESDDYSSHAFAAVIDKDDKTQVAIVMSYICGGGMGGHVYMNQIAILDVTDDNQVVFGKLPTALTKSFYGAEFQDIKELLDRSVRFLGRCHLPRWDEEVLGKYHRKICAIVEGSEPLADEFGQGFWV